ncbi:thioesterase [Paraburkholderia sp. NMBU_R16]|uniref:thioesterase family protein n=1 Tax=Paraburkholderia sp. NMBU_R16 TaxID=2698676 RepID=UPI001565787B|nr:thioesterase family protein [Paraburkholderia sp. NMBU_R16]NRO95081.1 thioesterase [Paraburkholderia sp. NMBU_R16]
MQVPIPPVEYRDVVRREWVDYNGHLRDAFYMLLFSYASDALLDAIGLDDVQRTARHRSVYTLEAHISYLHEVKEGASVRVAVGVLAHDRKRLHVGFEMFAEGRSDPVAAGEQMLLHVDTLGPRAAPFDEDVLERVRTLASARTSLPIPWYVGRVIGLTAKTDS